MRHIKKSSTLYRSVFGVFLLAALAVPMMSTSLMATEAHAVNVIQENQGGADKYFRQAQNENIKNGNSNIIRGITNILLFVLGTIAVIAIIIGGIKYTTSNGDASSIKSAKDMIMYAVVGLIAALLSWAIVGFVLDRF